MTRCKSGFSLVELVISFAILAMIALCVSLMMNSGTNMYTRVNKRVNLSYKTQVAMAQMKEYFIDCNGIAKFEEDDKAVICLTKTIRDKDNTGKFVNHLICYSFSLNTADNILYLEECEVVNGIIKSDSVVKQPFATKVTAFTAEYIENNQKYLDNRVGLSGINLKVTVNIDGTEYTKVQMVTFRNNPVCITTPDLGKTIKETLVGQVWTSWEARNNENNG